MDKYIGRLLDNRYEILEVIGTGGMAVVYKARCHRLNRLVAIKILKDDYLEDEDFRRRFHAESQAVAMLSHPNIVSVYDVSTSVSLEADYIVMELVDGITLKQYMEKKGVLNWKETLHFAIQIAKALEHAHSRGIVHRDIKPHNVMVLKNGSVKVTDFGIARMMSKGNTLTKEALGSVHYISPEQAKGGRVDSRSDIYSLGVVMYEMISGRPPFDGDSPVSVAIQHIDGGAPLPSTLNPNIPGGLEQIIMKAMAHDIEDRYASASKMLGDMDDFRKDPTVLFEYNALPLDAAANLTRTPLTLQPNRTTAERVADRGNARGTPRRPDIQRRAQDQAQLRRKRQAQAEASRSKAATIAIIACSAAILLALIIITLVAFTGGGNKLVEVPSFVGQVYREDMGTDKLDLIYEEVYDETVEAGLIISQNPEAGDKVVEGTKVVVQVSLGPTPQVVKMQNLVDMDADRARNLLESLNLNLQIIPEEEYHEDIIEGNVIRTEPLEGTELLSGQSIKLVISLGAEIKTGVMPNLVGKEEDYARRNLDSQDLELEIKVEQVNDATAPAGEIVKTEPAKGEDLKSGQEVILYISKGPETAKMPNVVGMAVDKAVNIVTDAGFETPNIEYVESNEAKDTVVTQSHEKNTKIDINSVITLQVSKGQPAKPTTVTKDVVLDIGTAADAAECQIKVVCNGEAVFNEKVSAGTKSVTVKNITGYNTMKFEIYANDVFLAMKEVVFTTNG